MEICANCEQVQGHFLEPNTGHPVCSNLCAQELVDAFYQLYPFKNGDDVDSLDMEKMDLSDDDNSDVVVLYQENGIKMVLHDKRRMKLADIEEIEKQMFTAYSNPDVCGTVQRQYLPYVMLKPELRYIVLVYALSSSHFTDPLQKYGEVVLGFLLCSETIREKENSFMIDLVCSPPVSLRNMKSEMQIVKLRTKFLELKLGPVIVQKFVNYLFTKKPLVQEIVLHAVKPDLISFYGVLGFTLHPAFSVNYDGHLYVNDEQTQVFYYGTNFKKKYSKIIVWDAAVDEIYHTYTEWIKSHRTIFLNYLSAFLPKYRENKRLTIKKDIDEKEPDRMALYYIEDQGFMMRLGREELPALQIRNFVPRALTNTNWKQMIVEVDERKVAKCLYVFMYLKNNFARYMEMKIPLNKVILIKYRLFEASTLDQARFEDLDNMIQQAEDEFTRQKKLRIIEGSE